MSDLKETRRRAGAALLFGVLAFVSSSRVHGGPAIVLAAAGALLFAVAIVLFARKKAES